MKTILKLSLVLLVAMTTMSTYAIDGDFLLNVKKAKGNEISFSVNGIKKAKVSIYDNENNLIYTENAKGQNGIIKTYNLDEFPVGTYYLVVENDLKEVRHEIKISYNESILNKRASLEAYYNTVNTSTVASND
ncbi:secretion protein [Flavobacterium restrictum]|uniref:Secretion protein n=1 Tax=Flavobacterium restrictum TaxID=2594428 RepID=A0A553EAX3_9FLAO|nr:secretion protein [Flavobacterium restrictum]TRX42112.1 secretion protein [Flavobacterium restrictum]